MRFVGNGLYPVNGYKKNSTNDRVWQCSGVFLYQGRVLTFERRDCVCGVDGIFTQLNEGEKVTIMDNLVYRPFGGAKATDTGSGDTIANQHDADGRLTFTNAGTPRERRLAFDANGNLTGISNPLRPWDNVAYEYDDTNRLTEAVGPYGLLRYTYDKAGNRKTRFSLLVDARSDIYEYETGTNRLSSVTGYNERDFDLDTAGNTILFDGKTLDYNADNRLISVTDGGIDATYSYNGFGQRILKTVTHDGVVTDTFFLWDFDGNIVAEYENGALKAEYLYRGANRLTMADAAGEVYFYQNDQLGTPLAITDKDNNAVWEATYLPFGQALVNPNSTVENYFRFPGQYFDEETGLHYNYHRYYDPETGRYVTADPIGLEGGINLFAYVQNNPVISVDPFGLEVLSIPGGTGWPDYTPTPLTPGQKTAIIKTAGGISAIAAGALLGQPTVIAGGIIITADGFALSIAELIGGDTSSIPSDYELIKQISEGLTENWPNNSDPCNQ